MKKIIVAGAGHGGLVAAAELAKAGYDVTVCESKQREELGHDWEDRFTFDVLSNITGKTIPDSAFRYRGDCAFVSPAYRTSVVIHYPEDKRQRVMERKYLINVLLDYAEECGVKFAYSTSVNAPLLDGTRVTGVLTSTGELKADLVIDAAGFFSPVRTKLPADCHVNEVPARGDAFYAYRAYFNRLSGPADEVPFEIYLYHQGEQGLSWFLTNENSVDVLIGRIDPLSQEKVDEQLAIFKQRKPWLGENVLRGGGYGVIPVRRPLSQLVCDGYAAVGDSAFMTTPMNGMGIDLSLLAGQLLAKTVLADKSGDYSTKTLWNYNREYHVLYGGDAAKNEGLKNALLALPSEGVDFLFDNAVIQSSDLAGAGKTVNVASLFGKFVRGMRNPKYFFAIIGGLIKGAKQCSAFKAIPETYDADAVERWKEKIVKCVVHIR